MYETTADRRTRAIAAMIEVVGVHFVPLAAVFRGMHFIPCILMTAVVVTALIVGLTTSVAPGPIAGLGAGGCLLVASVPHLYKATASEQ